ncbi:uncharacterized protein [Cicer arietinum]|uniref:Uncharacterized protein LOC101506881 isoform X2 n=1 Tax=Cicer arietinum TaxID=3827 RepID=A0A1S2YIY8_CICAR|nr:uncharacterized protein LOC101506881 isoform X2 [Cicer arietinum]
MILKTLMEEKQLNFNQPFLSVRRFSSIADSEDDNKRKTDKPSAKRSSLPAYKSDLKSGPVSNPGTVPFVWEKTPGRPKNDSKLQQTWPVEGLHIAPKLPPGRVLKVELQDFEKVTKGASVTQSRTESTVSYSPSVASLDSKEANHERRKEVILEKGSSCSDDEDETYLDARDTLSRTESFFMNCSVSGMSGWDDQEVRPSENFSADQQARDFMIGRFLPAAKAMASETPHMQYPSRKPFVRQVEQPRQVRKAESGAKSHPLDQKWQKVLPHYAQDTSWDVSDDESDVNDRYESYAPKICGLFPRFCLLNPLPGLRMEDKILNSAIHGVHGKSIASHRRSKKEEKSKHVIDPHRRGYEKSSASDRTQFESTCESPVVEKTLYVDSVHMVSSEMECPIDHRKDDFETLRKDLSIDKNPSVDYSNEDSKHMVLVNEKPALQPKDSVFRDSSLVGCSDKSSDDIKLKKITNHSNRINTEKQGLTKLGYQVSKLDHDFSVMSRSEIFEHKKIESKNEVSSNKISSDGLIQNPAPRRNVKLASDSEFGLKSQGAAKLVDQECTHVHDSNENASDLTSSKKVGGRKNDLENQLPMKLGHLSTSNASSLKHPLALPSPKAPSESWLKRTLPTVSSMNMPLRSNLAASIHAPAQTTNAALQDPKWEIIVKSSNAHRGHLRFAEELAPIPEA